MVQEVKILGTKILVAENKQEKVTESGLVIQGNTGDTKTGTVLSIGAGVEDVAVGDVVYLEWDKGTIVKIEDDYRLVIKEEFVIGILEK